jgi:hypothetical protein
MSLFAHNTPHGSSPTAEAARAAARKAAKASWRPPDCQHGTEIRSALPDDPLPAAQPARLHAAQRQSQHERAFAIIAAEIAVQLPLLKRGATLDPSTAFAGTQHPSQAARREALRSAVKLIRRRFGAGIARWASEIMEPGP